MNFDSHGVGSVNGNYFNDRIGMDALANGAKGEEQNQNGEHPNQAPDENTQSPEQTPPEQNVNNNEPTTAPTEEHAPNIEIPTQANDRQASLSQEKPATQEEHNSPSKSAENNNKPSEHNTKPTVRKPEKTTPKESTQTTSHHESGSGSVTSSWNEEPGTRNKEPETRMFDGVAFGNGAADGIAEYLGEKATEGKNLWEQAKSYGNDLRNDFTGTLKKTGENLWNKTVETGKTVKNFTDAFQKDPAATMAAIKQFAIDRAGEYSGKIDDLMGKNGEYARGKAAAKLVAQVLEEVGKSAVGGVVAKGATAAKELKALNKVFENIGKGVDRLKSKIPGVNRLEKKIPRGNEEAGVIGGYAKRKEKQALNDIPPIKPKYDPSTFRKEADNWTGTKANRLKRAENFYKKAGKSGSKADSELRGIDFDKPVANVKLKRDDYVYQYIQTDKKGNPILDRQGSYYVKDPSLQPSQLGISKENRKLVKFKITQNTDSLKSTASDIVWPNGKIYSGGGTQFYIPNAKMMKMEYLGPVQ